MHFNEIKEADNKSNITMSEVNIQPKSRFILQFIKKIEII